MTYAEALGYWYGRIDYERRAALPGDLKLDRMRAFLHRLGDPQQNLRLIHVAGTKGKGSTSAMIAQILQEAGYRVGLFTSPHLVDVRERIQVQGEWISENELRTWIEVIRPIAEEMESSSQATPTFFEMATALGLYHFFCRRVDFAVIEVGLGGRFDSTNVIQPLVSVITNISMDHMAQLGNSIEKIAFEKAGIIKPQTPVISSGLNPISQKVIAEIAAQRQSPLWQLGREIILQSQSGGKFAVQIFDKKWDDLSCGLLGQHQFENAAGAVGVIEQIARMGIPLAEKAVRHGLVNVKWPARLEIIRERPKTVIDCAHNVESMRRLVESLPQLGPIRGKKILILAISSDKQIPEILAQLAPHFQAMVLTKYASNPRYAAPSDLASQLKKLAPDARMVLKDSAAEAWDFARNLAGVDDLIVITGSVFLAGELRDLLRS